jgi:mannose-6-phosphate isomerase-like protein (cupin superfamily)
MRLAPVVALVAALAACVSQREGTARVQDALPEQAAAMTGGPVASASLHADPDVTANLVRITGPVGLHRHMRSEEVIYVLGGAGILHLRGVDRPVKAGDFVLVPRATTHGFEPTGTEPALILQLFTPAFVEGDRIFEEPPK